MDYIVYLTVNRKEEVMNRVSWVVLIGVVVLLAVSFLSKYDSGSGESKLVVWNTYKGEISGYFVEIDESVREYSAYKSRVTRLVHLNVIKDDGEVDILTGITGHDYDGEYTGEKDWDSIFYCGCPATRTCTDKAYGCNESTKTPIGWKFDPCPGDEDDIEEFTSEEIDFAINKLTEAMNTVYNTEHRVKTLEDWQKGLRL